MVIANDYDVGDLVRCSAEFKDAQGEYVDPDVVIFKVRILGQPITTHTYDSENQDIGDIIREDEGRYYIDVPASSSGTWYYRFESTGEGQAAEEQPFVVVESKF
jgi:hypothetical protein